MSDQKETLSSLRMLDGTVAGVSAFRHPRFHVTISVSVSVVIHTGIRVCYHSLSREGTDKQSRVHDMDIL